jgi:transcriptional regulator with XRE-family HTH domain
VAAGLVWFGFVTGDVGLGLLRVIGGNIAVRRRAAGITQAGLAEQVGRSVQWVSAVEQGRRYADRLIDLLRIAGVVGCSLEDLVGCSIDSLTIERVAG